MMSFFSEVQINYSRIREIMEQTSETGYVIIAVLLTVASLTIVGSVMANYEVYLDLTLVV
jgi:hypothetical protein